MRKIGQVLNLVGLGTDAWLRNMLRQFRAGRGFGEAFNNVGTDSGALAAVGSGAASLLGFASNWLRIAQLVEIVRYAAFPLMGYLLAILYVAFPLVLAAGILPGGGGRLVTYFALVTSVKAWPLAWAVVDQVYGYLLPALWPLLDRGVSAGNLIIDKSPAALNLVTGLMYLLGPVMLTTTLGSRAARWARACRRSRPSACRRRSAGSDSDSRIGVDRSLVGERGWAQWSPWPPTD